MLQGVAIPDGPAWAVAIGLVFTGLALLLKASLPLVQAIKHRNDKNGPGDALARQQAVADMKQHIDAVAKEAREHRDKIMSNVDETRHTLATPLSTLNLNLALMQQTLEQIRDRLPERR